MFTLFFFLEFRLPQHQRATFILTYMGSVEVAHHKGNDVLVQAISKVRHFYQCKEQVIKVFYEFLGATILSKQRRYCSTANSAIGHFF